MTWIDVGRVTKGGMVHCLRWEHMLPRGLQVLRSDEAKLKVELASLRRSIRVSS
jgi:hypothetical protein